MLESLGYRVKIGENIYRDTYGYLASEMERADDINAMAADDSVKMVFFGGEGGNEPVPYLDFETIRRHPKIYCSYSDGTTLLNTIRSKGNFVTYYGQSPGMFSDLRYYDYSWLNEKRFSVFHSRRVPRAVCGGVNLAA